IVAVTNQVPAARGAGGAGLWAEPGGMPVRAIKDRRAEPFSVVDRRRFGLNREQDSRPGADGEPKQALQFLAERPTVNSGLGTPCINRREGEAMRNANAL
ncbi:MAG: hypothetical protein LBM56_03920, partial [Burkholderiaceae bacterium]|nr:hypothetical protein [Burkholderiaceae bacterium]